MATTEVTYTKVGVDAKLAGKADLPAGGSDGQALVKSGTTTAWTTIGTGGTVADATTTSKGVIELAGDLAGTAAAPALKIILGSSGTVGTPSQIPVLSYDAKGRITAVSSVAVNGGTGGSAVVTESVNSGGYAVLSSTSGGTSTTSNYLRGVAYAPGDFGTQPSQLTNPASLYGSVWEYGSQATYNYLASRGHKIIRLSTIWEHLQTSLGAPLDTTLLGFLTTALNYINNAGMKAIIDVHNYGSYATAASGYVPQKIGQGVVTEAHFIDLWTRLSTALNSHPAIYGYGLMNEAADCFSTSLTGAQRVTAWHTLTQQVVTAIRNNGDTHRIMVDDMEVVGLTHQWDLLNGAPWITDPAGNFAYEHHHYSDNNYSGQYTNSYATELSLAQSRGFADIHARDLDKFLPFLNWCRNYNVPGYVGEYGVPTVGTDAASWAAVSDALITVIDSYNMDYTWWAVGENWASYTLAPYTTTSGSNGVLNTTNPGVTSLENHPSKIATTTGAWTVTTISPAQVDAKIATSGGGGKTDVSLQTYLPANYVTDGSVAYDAAFASLLAGNTSVYIPDGTWLLNSTLNIPANVVSITLHPNAVIKTSVINARPITRTGSSTSPSVAISSGATAGSKVITLPSLGSIGGGAWLFVTSDDLVPGGSTYYASIRRVTSVSGTTLTLDQALPNTFTTNPRVYSLSLAPKLTLRGGKWRHANPTSVTGTRALFYFELTQGPDLIDVDITDNGGPAVVLAHSVGGRARNFGMADLLDNPTSNFYGQGISLEGATRDFVYESGTVVRCRTAVNTAPSQIAVGDIAAGSTGRGRGENVAVLAGVKIRDCNYGIDIDVTSIGFRVQKAMLENVTLGVQIEGDKSVVDIDTDGMQKYGIYILAAATNSTVAVRMNNPSSAPGSGAAAISNSGTNTRIRPSYMVSPPAGWVSVNSTAPYIFEGQGRLDGARQGSGTATYASFDSSGDVSSLGGSGGAAVSSTNGQAGSAYTLALTDSGNIVENTGTGILTITVPTDASVAFPVGSVVELSNHSTGSITLVGASGVTLNSPSGLRMLSQYASAAIRKRSATEWIVSGLTVV